MTDEHSGFGGQSADEGDLIEIDLNFESMRRFQAEFSPNLSKEGLFIDTGEPLGPGSVVRFRVILPEEFVFLEGTAVVEWTRRAEAVSDGPPGMALRFVTLSPQNQELVEQLVQDHVGSGGLSFDLDVRPIPMDFPTDALEGAPEPPSDSAEDGYRLTFRGTEPNVQAEALKALVEASPDPADDGEEPAFEAENGTEAETHTEGEIEVEGPEEEHDFEIVSSPPAEDAIPVEMSGSEPRGTIVDEPTPVIGEPPTLDWSDEGRALAEIVDEASPAAADGFVSEVDASSNAVGDEPETADDGVPAETEVELLPAPSDFDDGPELMAEVVEEDIGSPAFNVSLPEHDDEPDTTPVLPDEGRDDVTVTEADDDDAPGPRRRLWPYGLAALFALAIAGGFLWPYVSTYLAQRDGGPDSKNVLASVNAATEGDAAIGDEQVANGNSGAPDPEDASSGEGDLAGSEPITPRGGEPVGETPILEVESEQEIVTEAVALGPADTITAIEVDTDARGTVVRIRANGNLTDGAISLENLSSPPRALLRVRGIGNDFRPYTIETSTSEVTRLRIGLHDERRPSELWVVLDLAGSGSAVGGIEIRGDVAEFVVQGR